MSDRLRLFVSVGPGMDQEREHIGQAVARLPISQGWAIEYTPSLQEARGTDASPILSCHFHLILLGADITAPMGWELWVARKAGKVSIAFDKEIMHTPAALVFRHESGLKWIPFRTPAELGVLVQEALAERLLEDPPRYGLGMVEWENLSSLYKKLRGPREPERTPEELRGSGAGQGGVILSPGRDLPPGGVLIGGGESKRATSEDS